MLFGYSTTPVSTQQSTPITVPGIDKPVIVVDRQLTGTVNWTNNFYWVLRGAVFVRQTQP